MKLGRAAVKGVGWNLLGAAAGLLLQFAFSVMVARALGTTGYAALSIILAVIPLAVTFLSLGFEPALNRFVPRLRSEGRPGHARALLKWFLAVRTVLSAGGALFLYVTSGLIAGLLQRPDMEAGLRLAAVLLVPFAVDALMRGHLSSFYSQREVAVADASSRGLALVIALYLLQAGWGVAGALAGLLAGELLFLGIAFWQAGRLEGGAPPTEKSRRDRAFAMRYAVVLYLFSVVNYVLGPNLDILMLGAMWPDAAAPGLYSIAYGVAYMAVSAMGVGLAGGISLTVVSDLHERGDRRGLARSLTAMLEYHYLFILPAAAGVFVLADMMIGTLYGPAFSQAGYLLALYILPVAYMKLGAVTSTYLSAMDMERPMLAVRLGSGLANLVMNLVLIPPYGPAGALVATAISGAACVTIEMAMVARAVPVRGMGRFLLRAGGAAAAVGLAVYALRYIGMPLVVLAAAGLLLYALLVLALRPLSRGTVRMLLGARVPAGWLVRRLGQRATYNPSKKI